MDVDELEAAIRPETALVSVMHVNNEIGVIQPIERIGAGTQPSPPLFHSPPSASVCAHSTPNSRSAAPRPPVNCVCVCVGQARSAESARSSYTWTRRRRDLAPISADLR